MFFSLFSGQLLLKNNVSKFSRLLELVKIIILKVSLVHKVLDKSRNINYFN